MHKLTKAKTNVTLLFDSVEGGRAAVQRLTEMGLTPGERLKVLNNSRHGPVTVVIKGTKVALGYALADKIVVKEERE